MVLVEAHFNTANIKRKTRKKIRPISSSVSLLFATFVASKIDDSSGVSNC